MQGATGDKKNEMDIVWARIAENCVVDSCYYLTAADADKSLRLGVKKNIKSFF